MTMDEMFTDHVTAIGEALGLEGRFLVEYGFEQIMAKLLPPPPEMETVEVVRWECEQCGFSYKAEPTSAKCLHPREHHMDPSETTYIKLTGHFQRPKPVKVERSEKITLWPGKWSMEGVINGDLPLRGVIHWQE